MPSEKNVSLSQKVPVLFVKFVCSDVKQKISTIGVTTLDICKNFPGGLQQVLKNLPEGCPKRNKGNLSKTHLKNIKVKNHRGN